MSSNSLKEVFFSVYPWSSLSRCNPILWSNWRRLGSIVLFTISPPVFRTFSYKMTILATLEATSRAITTHLWVIPTTHNIYNSLSTPLSHTTLRIRNPRFKVLRILSMMFTFVSGVGTLADDVVGPLSLWKDDQFTLQFWCPNSFHDFSLLFLNSTLSLFYPSQLVALWSSALLWCPWYLLVWLPYFP